MTQGIRSLNSTLAPSRGPVRTRNCPDRQSKVRSPTRFIIVPNTKNPSHTGTGSTRGTTLIDRAEFARSTRSVITVATRSRLRMTVTPTAPGRVRTTRLPGSHHFPGSLRCATCYYFPSTLLQTWRTLADGICRCQRTQPQINTVCQSPCKNRRLSLASWQTSP